MDDELQATNARLDDFEKRIAFLEEENQKWKDPDRILRGFDLALETTKRDIALRASSSPSI